MNTSKRPSTAMRLGSRLFLMALSLSTVCQLSSAQPTPTAEKEWNCVVFKQDAWHCALNSEVAEAKSPAYCRRHLVLQRVVMPEQFRNMTLVLDKPRPSRCLSQGPDAKPIPCPTDEVVDSCKR
jgi:hypothetical protein